ncbi:MBL fold metallo-hydrolase [Promicromonospora thailandica]|uniref:L-ascorbate metabolism protein UlaG, beta-lactamase superfamily n=1 Tax=Promicromonospora thailandica TaxID=765201 RepID=A0A9X2JVT4_9MICO|nr:MBL fold metallo-hydrolase [Promicromonospora thailandica]MCP2265411.1 L-ascorbate metabolism protein UlaG, beta-lactamase superfamily [Promicromonospora thailandica]
MQLTFHGHACVGITLPDGARLTLDPGSLSDDTALTDATAVLVTHDHIDHLDPAPVVEHLRTRTDARLWAPPSAVEALVAAGAPAERVQAVSPGDVLEIGEARVRVGGGVHAQIHPDTPPLPVNVTYLTEVGGQSLYHPGDSFEEPGQVSGGRLDVLLLPVSGPWMKLREAIDMARAVPAGTVVPIHDGLLSPTGLGLVGRWLDTARLGGDYTYARLAPGQSLTV